MANNINVDAKVAEALEAFTNVDERAFDDDVASLIEDAREGLKPLLDVLDIVVEPDQEVGQTALQKRARQAALAAVDFAYSQPGLLGPAKWARVGEGVSRCIELFDADLEASRQKPQEARTLDAHLHDLYKQLDAYYLRGIPADDFRRSRQVEEVLLILDQFHYKTEYLGRTDCPVRDLTHLRESLPPSDGARGFEYGVTARRYAAQFAKRLISDKVTLMPWMIGELIPLIASLPVAAPAS
jgi:hypothetical protein